MNVYFIQGRDPYEGGGGYGSESHIVVAESEEEAEKIFEIATDTRDEFIHHIEFCKSNRAKFSEPPVFEKWWTITKIDISEKGYKIGDSYYE